MSTDCITPALPTSLPFPHPLHPDNGLCPRDLRALPGALLAELCRSLGLVADKDFYDDLRRIRAVLFALVPEASLPARWYSYDTPSVNVQGNNYEAARPLPRTLGLLEPWGGMGMMVLGGGPPF